MSLTIVAYGVLLALIVLSAFVLRYQGIATALVWSMIVLESVLQQRIGLFLSQPALLNVAVAAVAAMAAFISYSKRGWQVQNIPREVYLYSLLVALAAVSFMWSVSPGDTKEQILKQLPYVIAFGFLAPACLYNSKQLEAATTTLIHFGALVLLGVSLGEFGRRGIVLSVEAGKTLEANPLAIASFAAYVAFASLFRIWRGNIIRLATIYYLAVVGIAIVVMIKSGSRGQLIAFSGLSLIFVPLIANKAASRSMILALMGTAVVATFAIYMVDYLGFSNRWKFEDLSRDQSGRFSMADAIIQENLKHGPTAWGLGLGSSASYKYLRTYPHNVYAETFAELGLLGIGLLAMILASCLRKAYRLVRVSSLSKNVRLDVSTIFAIYCFTCILAFKEGSLLGCSISVFSTAISIAWIYSQVAAGQFASTQMPATIYNTTPVLPRQLSTRAR